MICRECSTSDDLLEVPVIDLSEEDADTFILYLCLPCLKLKGLHCDKHGQHELVIYEPSILTDSAGLGVCSACLECSAEDVETMSCEQIEVYREALTEDRSQAFLDGLEVVGAELLDRPLDARRKSAFAIALAARLCGMTTDETVIHLSTNATSSNMVH
jgi:hypothetical protein